MFDSSWIDILSIDALLMVLKLDDILVFVEIWYQSKM